VQQRLLHRVRVDRWTKCKGVIHELMHTQAHTQGYSWSPGVLASTDVICKGSPVCGSGLNAEMYTDVSSLTTAWQQNTPRTRNTADGDVTTALHKQRPNTLFARSCIEGPALLTPRNQQSSN
jgi:hypothetical protein